MANNEPAKTWGIPDALWNGFFIALMTMAMTWMQQRNHESLEKGSTKATENSTELKKELVEIKHEQREVKAAAQETAASIQQTTEEVKKIPEVIVEKSK